MSESLDRLAERLRDARSRGRWDDVAAVEGALMAWNKPATPTPQAQAGDAVVFACDDATNVEHAIGYFNGLGTLAGRNMARSLTRLLLAQAPARDAGAVAWRYRSCAGFGLAPGEWSAWKTVIGNDETIARAKAANRPDLYEVRPLGVIDTHPAAASDDARGWRYLVSPEDVAAAYENRQPLMPMEFRDVGGSWTYTKWDPLSVEQRRVKMEAGRQYRVALTPPDGRGEGSA